MKGALLQRQLLLAAIAALAVLAVLAEARHREAQAAAPAPVGSYTARVGATSAAAPAPSGCGATLDGRSEGLIEPVLPCGLSVYVTYRRTTVLATVVAHTPVPPGRQFNLTRALAERLSLPLNRSVEVRWSYAGG